jgi:archaellum biogenesis protein FlaJ (TadC family)
MSERIKRTQEWFSANIRQDTSFATAFGAFQDSLGKSLEKQREEFFGRLNEEWRNCNRKLTAYILR